MRGRVRAGALGVGAGITARRVLPQGIHPRPGLSELHTWGPQHPKWTPLCSLTEHSNGGTVAEGQVMDIIQDYLGAGYNQKVAWHLISQSKRGWSELMFNRDN